MMLTQLRPGETARVTSLDGGCQQRQKLSLRGVTEGSLIRVISNMGPVTIEVDRNIVSIGRGMSHHIHVQRL